MKRSQILFITSNRLGDAILSTGILEALHKQHPDAAFTIACGPIAAPIFEDHPAVRSIIYLNRKGVLGHWWRLWQQTFLTFWHHVVDIRGSAFAYCVLHRARSIWRSRRAPAQHRVEQLANLLQLSETPNLKIYVSQQRHQKIQKWLKNQKGDKEALIALAPMANWAGKQWPLERYSALIHALSNLKIRTYTRCKFLILAAPDEYPQLKPLMERHPSGNLIVLPEHTHLLECAAALSQCCLFVGNDSGLMHMAAALDVPTVGLFGPSPDQLYAPWGRHTSVVRTLENYGELWARHLKDPQAELMLSITVDHVMAAIEQLLETL